MTFNLFGFSNDLIMSAPRVLHNNFDIYVVIIREVHPNVTSDSTEILTPNGAETAHTSGPPDVTPVFSGVHVDKCLVVCIICCHPLFVFWTLYYLFPFELWFRFAPLVFLIFFLGVFLSEHLLFCLFVFCVCTVVVILVELLELITL